jgi:hypothetical protein
MKGRGKAADDGGRKQDIHRRVNPQEREDSAEIVGIGNIEFGFQVDCTKDAAGLWGNTAEKPAQNDRFKERPKRERPAGALPEDKIELERIEK